MRWGVHWALNSVKRIVLFWGLGLGELVPNFNLDLHWQCFVCHQDRGCPVLLFNFCCPSSSSAIQESAVQGPDWGTTWCNMLRGTDWPGCKHYREEEEEAAKLHRGPRSLRGFRDFCLLPRSAQGEGSQISWMLRSATCLCFALYIFTGW